MLILSQDKEAIHNFNNTMSIQIERSNGNYKLYLYDTVDYGISLGEYDTKERAKAVLQEIIKRYKDENYYTGKAIYHKQLVYEMPEK